MMVAMERGVVAQWAIVLLLSLLHFVSLPNERLGGPGITMVRDFRHCAYFLLTNDKMLIKTLLQPLPLWYCFQQIKSLHYHLMPKKNKEGQ